jgi:hypothetical protein
LRCSFNLCIDETSTRRLSETNADGKTTETTTTLYEKVTKKMSIIYLTLYTLANLEGLYTFLVIIVGLFLRPIIDKIFHHDIINLSIKTNKLTPRSYSFKNYLEQIEMTQHEKNVKRETVGLRIQQLPSINNGNGHAGNSFNEFEPLVKNRNGQNYNPSMKFQKNKWQKKQPTNMDESNTALYK